MARNVIPAEAVEAAAKAEFEYEFPRPPAAWRAVSEDTRNRYREHARVGLESAASYMLAPLVATLDRWAGRNKPGYYDEAQDDVVQILNPYRSQA
jgi:hypothetical protein